jgi:hypothetical protein
MQVRTHVVDGMAETAAQLERFLALALTFVHFANPVANALKQEFAAMPYHDSGAESSAERWQTSGPELLQ